MTKCFLSLLLGTIIGFMPWNITFIIAIPILGYSYYIVSFKIRKLHKHPDYLNIKAQDLQQLLKLKEL